MSIEYILPRPHAKSWLYDTATTHPRALRIYPSAPDRIHLQIRTATEKQQRVAAVELTHAETAELRDTLARMLKERGYGS